MRIKNNNTRSKVKKKKKYTFASTIENVIWPYIISYEEKKTSKQTEYYVDNTQMCATYTQIQTLSRTHLECEEMRRDRQTDSETFEHEQIHSYSDEPTHVQHSIVSNGK